MIATIKPALATPTRMHHDRTLESLLDEEYSRNEHLRMLEFVENARNRSFQRDPYTLAPLEESIKNTPPFPLPSVSTSRSWKAMLSENHGPDAASNSSIRESMPDAEISAANIDIKDWDGAKFFSDYIKEGVEYMDKNADEVIMLFESPSTTAVNTSFHNGGRYRFYDFPPPLDDKVKGILGPCRYALMNGSALPVFLRRGVAPLGLIEHWFETVPGSLRPTFVSEIADHNTVYAYLPVENIKNHVNDPDVHYHLVGKDTIANMTQQTTRFLPDTRNCRPCVTKTTHSMGGKGIFVIRNDDDESDFRQFLVDAGNPSYVVTEFVDIERNVACHFFMHPNWKDVVWFGSNENKRLPDGTYSSDSYLDSTDQEHLKRLQVPFVRDVVEYCKSLGFWGFCGIDVLFDTSGRGYLVDVNPRVTGSCPGLMTLALMRQNYGFQVALMRRSGDINFYGTPDELFEQVKVYNDEHNDHFRVVILSLYQPDNAGDATAACVCRINIAVYGNDMEQCQIILNKFAKPPMEQTV